MIIAFFVGTLLKMAKDLFVGIDSYIVLAISLALHSLWLHFACS
jgi:hypothetical protein